MKRLIHIVGILLLTSCHQPSGVDVRDTTDNITENTVCQKDYHMEPVIYDTIFGNFITPRHTDTLILKYYSATTNRLVDSIAVGNRTDMDAAPWFYAQGIGIRVYLPDGTLVHTQPNATGLICAIPLNNLLPKTNALAIVWYPRQESGIMPCRIVSIENGQWTELGSFMVNTNFFPDTLTDGMIDDFLEKHNGIWMYRDYDEQMQWYEEHEGKCPMKPLLNILNTRTKKYNFQENIDYLCYWGYDHDEALRYNSTDSAKVDSIAKLVRKMNLRMTPYNTLSEIKKEFNKIFDNWYSTYDFCQRDMLENILRSRMQFHLSNPVTYRYWQSSNDYNPLKVAASPDGKLKFYTTWNISDGTMGGWITFYQYIDSNGKLVCKEWQGDRRFDCQSNPTKVWQFTYHDSTFYVLKSFWRACSCEWGYSMEIATFDNGEPTYHIHFFPNMKEYNEIKKLSYVNGEWEESDWVREGGSYCVSYTCRFLDVDNNFDPKTLTVTATTQADTGEVVKTERWKLKTDKDEQPCKLIAWDGIIFDTTIVGHFSSLQNNDKLQIIAYSTTDKQYVNINQLPKNLQGFELLDSIGGAWNWHIFLNGKLILIDSTYLQLLYLEKLNKTMPDGRDAIAVVFDNYGNHYPDCSIMGFINGKLTQFAEIGISIHRCMNRYIRKEKGEYLYYSIEGTPEDDSMVKYRPIKNLIAESIIWQY